MVRSVESPRNVPPALAGALFGIRQVLEKMTCPTGTWDRPWRRRMHRSAITSHNELWVLIRRGQSYLEGGSRPQRRRQ